MVCTDAAAAAAAPSAAGSISEVELIRGQQTNNELSDGYLHPQEATWDGGGA